MKCATVYGRSDRYIVCSLSRTTTGVWISSEPFLKLQRPVLMPQLGDAILSALEASRQDVEHPGTTGWKILPTPLLRIAGVGSQAALQLGSHLVSVERTESHLSVVPHQNDGAAGPQRGFTELRTEAAYLDGNPSGETLGSAVIKAFKQCR